MPLSGKQNHDCSTEIHFKALQCLSLKQFCGENECSSFNCSYSRVCLQHVIVTTPIYLLLLVNPTMSTASAVLNSGSYLRLKALFPTQHYPTWLSNSSTLVNLYLLISNFNKTFLPNVYQIHSEN